MLNNNVKYLLLMLLIITTVYILYRNLVNTTKEGYEQANQELNRRAHNHINGEEYYSEIIAPRMCDSKTLCASGCTEPKDVSSSCYQDTFYNKNGTKYKICPFQCNTTPGIKWEKKDKEICHSNYRPVENKTLEQCKEMCEQQEGCASNGFSYVESWKQCRLPIGNGKCTSGSYDIGSYYKGKPLKSDCSYNICCTNCGYMKFNIDDDGKKIGKGEHIPNSKLRSSKDKLSNFILNIIGNKFVGLDSTIEGTLQLDNNQIKPPKPHQATHIPTHNAPSPYLGYNRNYKNTRYYNKPLYNRYNTNNLNNRYYNLRRDSNRYENRQNRFPCRKSATGLFTDCGPVPANGLYDSKFR